jgi:hypothetical protein
MDKYVQARGMEEQHVCDDDFHQFRVLGVGGFGAVHAAVKKDTGQVRRDEISEIRSPR